jgi:predicted acylesterase/phospholipase RssA
VFDAAVFAGGGNRCYWQGGFWEAAAESLDLRPRLVIGASAGAFAAGYALTARGPSVRARVYEACRQGAANFTPAAWLRGASAFPVRAMYYDLLTETLDAQAFAQLKAAHDFQVALARPPRRVPAPIAAMAGLVAYQLEKKLFHPVHPRFGSAIGFRPVYARIAQMESAAELVAAIYSAASVPPIMPVGRHDGQAVMDGGMVDNVPVAPLTALEAAGGRSLVLLTRRYRKLPVVAGRVYVEPSEPIPVKQFDIGNPQGIRHAYELGLRDGAAFARRQRGA